LRSWAGKQGSIRTAALLVAAPLPWRLVLRPRCRLLRSSNRGSNAAQFVITTRTTQSASSSRSTTPRLHRLNRTAPAVLIGGASGRLKGDRYQAYPGCTVPSSNLMRSILGMFDIQAESFGDSTGSLQNI
jgi:hypothetical protein